MSTHRKNKWWRFKFVVSAVKYVLLGRSNLNREAGINWRDPPLGTRGGR